MRRLLTRCGRSLFTLAATFLLPMLASAQGVILPGAGGLHQSMGGASTAVAADALGALYWNPAAISGLPGSEVVIGGAAIIPDIHLGSTIPAGRFGPFGPAETLSGYTRSDSGVGLTSNVGLVYKPDDSKVTFGLGITTLAGGSVNFPGNPSNPVLAPVGPFSRTVLGPQAGSMTVVSLMPTVSLQLTDRLAVGFSPMLDISVVSFDPTFFTRPNDANGDGLFTFPTGSHTRPFWGGGFRTGMTYRLTDSLVAGASFTSPQWFETWRFNARDEIGNPYTFTRQFTLPTIISAGLSYTGIERLLLSADVRWMDYRTTQLLGQPARDSGAGWDSIWVFALGGKYQVTENFSLQMGYIYNQNPIQENLALVNTMLPALTQHTLSAGFYYQITDSIGSSLAYVHGFKNGITSEAQRLPGTSVTIDSEYDAVAFGLHVKFGGSKTVEPRVIEGAACAPAVVAQPACTTCGSSIPQSGCASCGNAPRP